MDIAIFFLFFHLFGHIDNSENYIGKMLNRELKQKYLWRSNPLDNWYLRWLNLKLT